MNKLVWSVFKTLMLSTIFLFVLDMAFYVYRVSTLNTKMENLMTSMQKVVMENNGLTPNSKDTFDGLFKAIAAQYNRDTSGDTHNNTNNWNEGFIMGFGYNYNKDAYDIDDYLAAMGSNVTVHKQMQLGSTAHQYGDVCVVQVYVGVRRTLWNLDATNVTEFNREQLGTHLLNYTYFVPCMKYQTTNAN